MIDRKARKVYLWLHVGIVAVILLFPMYQFLMRLIPDAVTGCVLHDRLFLYCPLCGGTRAVGAILRLDFAEAWRCNALVTVGVFILLAVDLLALARLLRGKQRLLLIPGWGWIAAVILMVLYAVLRNYLMIAHGIDPTGDLGRVWQVFTSSARLL